MGEVEGKTRGSDVMETERVESVRGKKEINRLKCHVETNQVGPRKGPTGLASCWARSGGRSVS